MTSNSTNFTGSIWTKDFILLFAGNLLMGISFYFLISALPIYASDVLKADKSATGLALATYTIAALLIRPFAGIAVDSLGRKVIFIWAFLAFTIVTGGYTLATTIFILATLRFAHGLAWGASSTAGTTIAVDLIPPARRGEGIGHFGLAMTLAMAIGPAIGLWLSSDGKYDSMFITGFAICATGFLMILFIKYPPFNPHKENRGFKWKNLIEVKSLIPSFNVIFTQITYGGLISFIALFGIDIGIHNPGLFFLVYAGSIFLGRTFSGRVFDKQGPDKVITFGLLMLVVGFITLPMIQNYYGFLGSAFLLGLGNGVAIPAFQTMVNNMVEVHRRGAANSTYFTIFDLGIGIGMALIGFLSEMMSLSSAFFICSALCFTALVYFKALTLKYYQRNRVN